MAAAAWTGLALAALPLAACGSLELNGSGGTGGGAPVGATVRFDDPSTLKLAPAELATIGFATDPAEQSVAFLLLGDAANATLSASRVRTDASGAGSVDLRAPGAPGTFRLRAGVDGGSAAEIAVSVSDAGFGTLRILPAYTGKRHVAGWTASVAAGTTCAKLAPKAPDDAPGAIEVTGELGEALVVPDIPIGPEIAVVLRSERSIWGCAEPEPLVANQTTDLRLQPLDRPIDLSETRLQVDLGFDPDPAPYVELVRGAADELATAFVSEAGLTAALLDAMQASLDEPTASAFAEARANGLLTAKAEGHLAERGADFGPRVQELVLFGLEHAEPNLHGEIVPVADAPGKAAVELTSFAGVPAAAAGAPARHVFAWSQGDGDALVLEGTFFFLPTRYAGALAELAATGGEPPAQGAPALLALDLDCDGLAATLGPLDEACDVVCVADACRAGVALRWEIAQRASADAGLFGTVDLLAGGEAAVDGDARPLSFQGTWVGEVHVGGTSCSADGIAVGGLGAPSPE